MVLMIYTYQYMSVLPNSSCQRAWWSCSSGLLALLFLPREWQMSQSHLFLVTRMPYYILPPASRHIPRSALHTILIQIDAHALIDAHLELPLSSSSWHTKIGEVDDICIKMHGFEVRFGGYHYATFSCLAHAQCTTVRMNTVYPGRPFISFL